MPNPIQVAELAAEALPQSAGLGRALIEAVMAESKPGVSQSASEVAVGLSELKRVFGIDITGTLEDGNTQLSLRAATKSMDLLDDGRLLWRSSDQTRLKFSIDHQINGSASEIVINPNGAVHFKNPDGVITGELSNSHIDYHPASSVKLEIGRDGERKIKSLTTDSSGRTAPLGLLDRGNNTDTAIALRYQLRDAKPLFASDANRTVVQHESRIYDDNRLGLARIKQREIPAVKMITRYNNEDGVVSDSSYFHVVHNSGNGNIIHEQLDTGGRPFAPVSTSEQLAHPRAEDFASKELVNNGWFAFDRESSISLLLANLTARAWQ